MSVFKPERLNECVTCDKLGTCSTVRADPTLIERHHVCNLWQSVSRGEVITARINIINHFGRDAIDALSEKEKED